MGASARAAAESAARLAYFPLQLESPLVYRITKKLMRRILEAVRPDVGQQLILRCRTKELVARRDQRLAAEPGVVARRERAPQLLEARPRVARAPVPGTAYLEARALEALGLVPGDTLTLGDETSGMTLSETG